MTRERPTIDFSPDTRSDAPKVAHGAAAASGRLSQSPGRSPLPRAARSASSRPSRGAECGRARRASPRTGSDLFRPRLCGRRSWACWVAAGTRKPTSIRAGGTNRVLPAGLPRRAPRRGQARPTSVKPDGGSPAGPGRAGPRPGRGNHSLFSPLLRAGSSCCLPGPTSWPAAAVRGR